MSTIYDVSIIENQIEQIAMLQDGEIPEDKLQELVEAQMKLPGQIQGLVYYIKHLEDFETIAKAEEERIKNKRKAAEKRKESIKNYMIPLVASKGKIEFGTFTLSVRKSESVEIVGELNEKYLRTKTIVEPDKLLIKDELKKGLQISGAQLKQNNNLIIK